MALWPTLNLSFWLAGEGANKTSIASRMAYVFIVWKSCQNFFLISKAFPSFSQQPTTADANNTHEKKPRECETIAPLSSHSMGDIRPNSCTTTTTIVTMSMTERLKRSDLYSSSEYVRHSTGGNYDENGW